ncbi:hypothetical protein RI054_17g79080 [Pseudoscourfieldia marina]
MREKFTPGNREAQRRDGDASGPSHSGISRTTEKRNLRLAPECARCTFKSKERRRSAPNPANAPQPPLAGSELELSQELTSE